MLFNSHLFIFIYLPLVISGFYLLARYSNQYAAYWLALASLFFYAWWDWRYILLLIGSIAFNFLAGSRIGQTHEPAHRALRKTLTLIAVLINLCLLVYFKYTNFLLSILNQDQTIEGIVLPLGISFFTFTQIAYLVDVYKGKAKEFCFSHYIIFVTYFPHLIAGPILHHGEMMPQFAKAETYRFSYDKLALGLSIFFIGLFKKTELADGIASQATALFGAAAQHQSPGFLECWNGVIAYTLQLYFDFSGYSDMAIGLSCLFGVRLPLNFYSPYKSTNIIEFWRRWHMSLSRFLRDYLYIPLGGNRHGPIRRYFNLLITMLLGGLWHGANWTFVIWGGLHGIFLIINHVWRALREQLGQDLSHQTFVGRFMAGTLTFLAVMSAWVFFRASSIDAALTILKGMAGLNGFILPINWQAPLQQANMAEWLLKHGAYFSSNENPMFRGLDQLIWSMFLLLICWLAPNTQQLFEAHQPSFAPSRLGKSISFRRQWQVNSLWVMFMVATSYIAIISISSLSEFIYFQF